MWWIPSLTLLSVLVRVAIGVELDDDWIDKVISLSDDEEFTLDQSQAEPVNGPYRELGTNLGLVMSHGQITKASQKKVDAELERIDSAWENDNVDEMVTDRSADDGEENTAETVKGARSKRFLMDIPAKQWPDCVIPYTLDMSTLSPSNLIHVQSTMALYEYWTCIRFVPRTSATEQEAILGHTNYLNFVQRSGCWSQVGMQSKGGVGQDISCCGGTACVHEIGHALGFYHEQQGPDRDGFIRVNYDNIKPDFRYAFHKQSRDNKALFPWRYDYTSVMHYGLKAFTSNGQPTITVLDPHMNYLIGEHDSQYFYFFREAQEAFPCIDTKCSDFTAKCAYGGYLTYQEDQCVCRCIGGLDPATHCTTIKGRDQRLQNMKWTGTNFSMLKVQYVSCPAQSTLGKIVLFGPGKTSVPYNVAVRVTDAYTMLKFCTLSSSSATGQDELTTWPPGEYCIARTEGTCPQGFENGHIQYDDHSPPNTRGDHPDGEFTTDTLIEFCCRSDGNKDIPIELPTGQKFILWKKNKNGCQKVKDTAAISEFHEFTNKVGGNVKIVKPVPLFYKSYKRLGVYVCLYVPVQKGCGDIIELTESAPVQAIQSPNYPSMYDSYSVCTWAIQGPPDRKVVLTFSDFDIPTSTDDVTVCHDKVDIRSFLPGQPGVSYCGSGFQASVVSQTNILSLVLHSHERRSGSQRFNATVSLAPKDDELCYLPSDGGVTYRGQVSFTHDLRSCLPWDSVTHCPHHMYNDGDRFAGLDSNYCRNPGLGDRPWCYTDAENCVRDFCDVCGIGGCYNILENCDSLFLVDPTWCTLDLHIQGGVVGCARTCGLCDAQTNATASSLECVAPTTPPDAEALDIVYASYGVGETVHFRCTAGNNIRSRTCLTDGTWSGQGHVCQVCPDDWRIVGNHCYKYYPTRVTEVEAVSMCADVSGELATVRNVEERDLVYTLMLTDPNHAWLGLSDKISEGTFVWNDGSPLDQATSGLPWHRNRLTNSNAKDCVVLHKSRGLLVTKCSNVNAFVCQYTITRDIMTDATCGAGDAHSSGTPDLAFGFCEAAAPEACFDEVATCADFLQTNPAFCTEFSGFAVRSCASTCGHCLAD